MTRPHWHSATITAISLAAGLAFVAGCSTRHSGLTANDEMARYLQSARGRYTVPGPASDPWGPYIREASGRFDIPETWIRSLMRQESGGNLYRNGRLITSSAGAMGLMQVMPGTYRELRARHNLGPDPFEPHDNIMAGVGYMREMYDMYGAPGFLAAYNAGPNRLDDYLANQRGLPDETRKYVAAIGPSLRHAAPRVRSPAEQYAMNQVPLHIPAGPRYGYGSAAPIQVASAAPFIPASAPVYTPAYTPPLAPVARYSPPTVAVAQVQQQPLVAPLRTAQAWAAPPRPVYVPAPQAAPQPTAVAWAQPPRPVYTPAARPTQTVIIEVEEVDDPAPVARRIRPAPVRMAAARLPMPTRVAFMPTPPPVKSYGGGLHLISSAVAAEAFPARKHGSRFAVPASYGKPDRRHAATSKAPVWKLHSAAPIRKQSRGKPANGAHRL